MQTETLTVCSLDLFEDNFKHFWISDLEGLLEMYPSLEYPHKNNFYALLIVNEAQGEVEIDNQKIALSEAKIIVIKPRCINSISMNCKASGKIICFSKDFFSLRYNDNILKEFAFLTREARTSFRIASQKTEKLGLLLQLLQEEYSLKKSESAKIIRSYLNVLLFEIERMYSPLGIVKNKNGSHEKIGKFEALIEKHFADQKMPSYYADLLNVTPNYLNKLCKEETGLTAGDLIRKQVILESQRLLHFTNFTINEIAYKLGFENVSYFVTFFKKQMQVTPEKFRKADVV